MTLDMGGLQSQLTGRYPAIGVNNPKRYPKQPKKTTQQTTDDMKETLRSLMRRQHGSNP